MDIDHLSYSAVSKYTTCSESYKRQYITHEPHLTSPSLVFGTAFHRTAERLIKGEQIDPVEQWKLDWNEAAALEAILWDETTPDEQLAIGIGMFQSDEVLDMLQTFEPRIIQVPNVDLAKMESVADVEKKVQFEIPGIPWPIVGYIDVMCSDGIPLDIKTAARMWPQDKASVEMQPLFYLHALNLLGETEHQMRFRHVVFTKAKTPKVAMFETQRTQREIDFMLRMLDATYKGIAANIFVPNPNSWLCSPKYCEFYDTCRNGMPVLDMPTAPAPAEFINLEEKYD
jgi:hypothetical protein